MLLFIGEVNLEQFGRTWLEFPFYQVMSVDFLVLWGLFGAEARRGGLRFPLLALFPVGGRFKNDPATLDEILTIFVSDTERRLPVIREAIRTGNGDLVDREGHALKGGAYTIRAELLSSRTMLSLGEERDAP